MDASHGRSCVRCGRDDGTTVRAHYTGTRQHWYGKGRGIKGHDLIAADLCYGCHQQLDQPNGDSERDEEWSHLCWMTVLRDHEDGLITIKGSK